MYTTLLLLGEMATQYPVAGECFHVGPRRLKRVVSWGAVESWKIFVQMEMTSLSSRLHGILPACVAIILMCLAFSPTHIRAKEDMHYRLGLP